MTKTPAKTEGKRPRTAPAGRTRYLILWLLVGLLALCDVAVNYENKVRSGFEKSVLAVEAYPYRAPPVQSLSRGAPFTPFPARTCNYFLFRVHWLLLPFVGLALWTLQRFLARRGQAFSMAAGPLCALLFLILLNFLVIERFDRSKHYAWDPVTVWRMRPDHHSDGDDGLPWTDHEGRRPTPPGSPNGAAILMLGDSSTFGVGLKNTTSTHPWLVARELAAIMPGAAPRVFNCATPGFTSWQGLNRLRLELPRIHPRIVTAAFMANDWSWATQTDLFFEQNLMAGGPLVWLRRSNLYLLLDTLLWGDPDDHTGMNKPTSTTTIRVSPAEFESNIIQMQQLSTQSGATFVLICLPLAQSLDHVSAPYREVEARLARRIGFPFIDIYDDWKQRGWNIPHDNDPETTLFWSHDPIHPTAPGQAEIARAIVPQLYKLLRPEHGLSRK